jgi:hypothetical protein
MFLRDKCWKYCANITIEHILKIHIIQKYDVRKKVNDLCELQRNLQKTSNRIKIAET